MIAVDYIELLEQGVDAWNRWRSDHPDERPNLESAYLFEKALPNINLSQTNLSRACLIGADLTGADLTGANLQGVYANNANFQDARLTGAALDNGNLMEANLTRADLSEATIDNANFTNAHLVGTCLAGWPDISIQTPPKEAQPDAKVQNLEKPAPPPIPAAPTSKQTPLQFFPPLPKYLIAAVSIVMPFAIATILLYRIFSPKPPQFVSADGTVTIPLVCDEPDVIPIEATTPDYTYQNGTRFYGTFANGKPANGRGTMIYSNGNRYDGEYRDGKRNGCGSFIFDNGRRYIGQFDNDLFSGRGIWLLENGNRYVGDFEFNRCNGEGVYIFADGTSKSGIWQQGRLLNSDLTCNSTNADSSVRNHPTDVIES